jgi:hypothetical protein
MIGHHLKLVPRVDNTKTTSEAYDTEITRCGRGNEQRLWSSVGSDSEAPTRSGIQ